MEFRRVIHCYFPEGLHGGGAVPCTGTAPPTSLLVGVPAAPAGGCLSSSPQREASSTGVSDQMLDLKVERFGLVLAVETDFVAGPEEADVEVVTGVDVVLSAVVDGDHDVVAGTAEDDVVVVAAIHGVVAAVADHGVLTVAAEEVVVTGVAPDDVVTVATVDVVVAGRATDHVVAVAGVDDVVTVGADDVIVLVGAVEEGRAVLAGRVQPGVAGRTAVTEPTDGVGRTAVEQAQTDEEAGRGR